LVSRDDDGFRITEAGLSLLDSFDIRRQTRRQYSAEENIRIILEGSRGEESPPPEDAKRQTAGSQNQHSAGADHQRDPAQNLRCFPRWSISLNLAAARLRYIAGAMWSVKCTMNNRPLNQQYLSETEAVA
jgi:hypothetical protein